MKLLRNAAIIASIVAAASCGSEGEKENQNEAQEFTNIEQDYSELPQGIIARVPVDQYGMISNQSPEIRSYYGSDLSDSNVEAEFLAANYSDVYGQDPMDINLASPQMFNLPGQFLGTNGKVGQYPGQNPGKVGQYPGQNPGKVGQYPGQHPGKVGQYPGQYPGKVGQYPGQHPGKVGQYPGQHPGKVGQYPGQYPGKVGQYPGQYPGKGKGPVIQNSGKGGIVAPGQYPGQNPGKGGKGKGGVYQSPFQFATDAATSYGYDYSYKLDFEVSYNNSYDYNDYYMNRFRPIHRSRYYPRYNWGYYNQPRRWTRGGYCYYYYPRPVCNSYRWCRQY